MAFIKPVSFVTFGMFIIDEIEWSTPNPPPSKYNLIGGAGTYAVLGARLASSPCQLLSRSISWIVDVGSNFPDEIKTTIDGWNTDCVQRVDTTRLTTRAWNGYGEQEHRDFKYLTAKRRLEVSSLNRRQIMSKSFHMVCSPSRCIDITTKLQTARDEINPDAPRPIIIWEPIPDVCSPDELTTLQQAAQACTVVSPNHDELKMFFSADTTSGATQEQLSHHLMGWNGTSTSQGDSQHSPILIVREGANGSTAYVPSQSSQSTKVHTIHLPAYHDTSMSSSVVDPTGGGNTYLGALAIALTDVLQSQSTWPLIRKHLNIPSSLFSPQSSSAITNSNLQSKAVVPTVAIAMIYASLAASFAIEQHGTPTLKQTKVFTEIFEEWNGEKLIDRLRRYLEREGTAIRVQLEIK